MNKAELVEAISKKTKTPKTHIEYILNTTLEIIRENVRKGEEVKLVGFGTFTKSKRNARVGHNPQTGEAINIPSTWYPKFRPGSDFKASLKS